MIRHYASPMKVRSASCLMPAIALACTSGPRRIGPLAGVADSLLPRLAAQVCFHVPPQTGVAYETGYFDCSSDPDSLVQIKLLENGQVTSVSVRTSVDTQSSNADGQLEHLRALYGPGQRMTCG